MKIGTCKHLDKVPPQLNWVYTGHNEETEIEEKICRECNTKRITKGKTRPR